jgi:cation transporter-like permease
VVEWEQAQRAEREERRGLEQRAATLVAALLFTIGLVATGARDLAGSGLAARILLTAAMGILLLAVALLAVALTRRTSDDNRVRDLLRCKRNDVQLEPASDDSVKKIIQGNVTILLSARLATFLLGVGVAAVVASLIVSFFNPGPQLGSSGNAVQVHMR